MFLLPMCTIPTRIKENQCYAAKKNFKYQLIIMEMKFLKNAMETMCTQIA